MTGFRFNSTFNQPYYGGAGTADVGSLIGEVGFAGRRYMIDWTAEIPLRHVSIPVMRQQQDTSDAPGEQSINAESLWRRSIESWHIGAGQTFFDRKESDPFRFRTSKGVDVWQKWQLGLHKRTVLGYDDAGTNQKLAVAGSHLYYTQGNAIRYITSLGGAENNITGEPVDDPVAIASNGYHVWTAHGASGIYRTTRGAAATASHITGTVSLVTYVKNRVMAAGGLSLYDVTSLAVGASGALPAALFTHGNSDWQWVAFAESQQHIYAAGYSGDKSIIYSVSLVAEGTALGAPTAAGVLPDGEVVTSLHGYLGRFLAIGTNKGFRLALVSEGGGLTIGARINTPDSVLCFEGQEEFIWYGLSSFDVDATGLGRFSTAQFSNVDALLPTYASDLMADDQTNDVTDVCTFENRRVFAVSGIGIYYEHDDEYVESGYLDSGLINYGMTDPKTALYIDATIDGPTGTDATIEIWFSTDGASFVPVSTLGLTSNDTISLGEASGHNFETRLVFNRGTDASEILTLYSWLLRVQPQPRITRLIYATILLAPVVTSLQDTPIDYVTLNELSYIEELNESKTVTTFQHTNNLWSVVLEDYEVNIVELIDDTDGRVGFNSSATLKMKEV